MKILFILLFIIFSTKEPIYPPVYVEWVDIIATDSGWHSKEDLDTWIKEEQDTVKQIGFLYKDTIDYIILIDSYFNYDNLGSATKIPKCNIIIINKID